MLPDFNPKIFDDIAKRLNDAVPQGIRDLQGDLQQKFRDILLATFSKFDLVTREEFDTQVKVLARTRVKLESLEQKVRELENNSQKE